MDRGVRHVVGQVEEERTVLRASNEAESFLRIASCEHVLICWFLDRLLVAHQGRWLHIVAVWNAKVVVEAVVNRAVRREMTEVPFPNTSCRIATFFQSARDR